MVTLSTQPIRKIIHIDMDAFFASVEQRDNADWRGKPIVVGGLPEHRGVVAAASYEARVFGIHAAMPSRTAVQRCPQLIFAKPRFDVYRAVSEQIRDIFCRYTDLVEPLSLDEAYLDVTVNKKEQQSAVLTAREIKALIYNETGLTASAGISINKFLAKVASNVNKPDGLFLIAPDHVESFLEKLAIEKFYGVGPVTAEKMRSLGIHTGADLKLWSQADLAQQFGKAAYYYFNVVRGCDDREVTPDRIRKSIGAEESFAEDLVARAAIVAALEQIAQTLKDRIEDNQTSGRTLTLKVKYGDYQQITRSRTVARPVYDIDAIMKLATELLDSTEIAHRHVRLLGLTVSNLDSDTPEETCVQLTLELKYN